MQQMNKKEVEQMISFLGGPGGAAVWSDIRNKPDEERFRLRIPERGGSWNVRLPVGELRRVILTMLDASIHTEQSSADHWESYCRDFTSRLERGTSQLQSTLRQLLADEAGANTMFTAIYWRLCRGIPMYVSEDQGVLPVLLDGSTTILASPASAGVLITEGRMAALGLAQIDLKKPRHFFGRLSYVTDVHPFPFWPDIVRDDIEAVMYAAQADGSLDLREECIRLVEETLKRTEPSKDR